ncbi:MAG TPA: phosphatidylinositol-specific phospholipase C [Rhizomicrobium sp.]|jgi:1-phosphatidylinositol phosphodiesterase|nr:phosphatidylinositol-specific phospholipase C [Rhizomicrobium sp.]
MTHTNNVDLKTDGNLKIVDIQYRFSTLHAPNGTDHPTAMASDKSETKWVVTLDCDQDGNTAYAEAFNKACGGAGREYAPKAPDDEPEPKEMNFCFEMQITFSFQDGAVERKATANVYFGQNNHGVRHIWWLGGQDSISNVDGMALLLASTGGSAASTVTLSIAGGHSDFTFTLKSKTNAIDLPTWMSGLDGETSLANVTLPGTHDTCSRFGGPWTETQNRILTEQLNDGTRFIDIRCRHYQNSFPIHHGSKYQEITFQQVLEMCLEFLAKNKNETIVMSIKEEYDAAENTETFEQTFLNYLQKNDCWTSWYLDATMPTLAQVRGKIVLFRRFDSLLRPVLGLKARPWEDNTTFTISNTVKMTIQDHWNLPVGLGLPGKWKDVKALLDEAKGATDATLFVDFCSAWSIATPSACAAYINPRLTEYFTANLSGHFGAILMDFETADLNRLLVQTNF